MTFDSVSRLLTLFPFLLLITLLVSCSSHNPEAYWSNYLSRIENSFEHIRPTTEPEVNTEIPMWPRKRDRNHNFPETNTSLWSLISLGHCPLAKTVAANNNQLGKVRLPSEQFIFQQQLLFDIPQCIDLIDQSDPIRQQLQDMLKQKFDSRLDYFWFGIFDDPAFEDFTSLSVSGHNLKSGHQFSQEEETFKQFINSHQQVFDNKHPVNRQRFLGYLKVLETRKGLGHWLKTIQVASQYLPRLNHILQQAENNAYTCKNIKVIQKVFTKFFVGEIQPQMAWIKRGEQQLFNQLKLLSQKQNAPGYLIQYTAKVEAFYQDQYLIEMNQHIEHWQRVLSRCQVMPTRP